MSIKPDYQRGPVTLYCGDCLDVLPEIEAGSVDAVVTDPPWGIGYSQYETHDDSATSYADDISMRVLAAEVLVRQGGYMAVYQAMPRARVWHSDLPRPWKIIALPMNFVQLNRGDIAPSTDFVLWWRLGKGEGKARDWQEIFARNWFVCDTSPASRNRLSRGHPCPRPVDGVTYLLKCFTPPGGTVLDHFMGSGTCGDACVQSGRRFVGIEREPKYFDIAVKRIDASLRQGQLRFARAPRRKSQAPSLDFGPSEAAE